MQTAPNTMVITRPLARGFDRDARARRCERHPWHRLADRPSPPTSAAAQGPARRAASNRAPASRSLAAAAWADAARQDRGDLPGGGWRGRPVGDPLGGRRWSRSERDAGERGARDRRARDRDADDKGARDRDAGAGTATLCAGAARAVAAIRPPHGRHAATPEPFRHPRTGLPGLHRSAPFGRGAHAIGGLRRFRHADRHGRRLLRPLLPLLKGAHRAGSGPS